MPLGIGGDIVGRTARRVDADLVRQLAEQQFAQQVREFEAQQARQAEMLEMDRAQQARLLANDEDDRRYRQEQQERQRQQDREGKNTQGIRRMTGEFLMQRTGAITPEDRRAVAALQVEAGEIPDARLLAEPEDPNVVRQRELEDYEKKKKIDARYREPQRETKPRIDIRSVPARGPNGEPGTKMITLYDGIPIREQWEPGNPSAGERTGLAMNDAAQQSLADLESLYDPGYVGPVMGRAGQLGQQIPGVPVNEGAAQFYGASAAFRNSVIKAITGAQMSEPEARRITQQIPMPEDKPEVWQAKAAQSRLNLQRIVEQQRARQGLAPARESAPPAGGSLYEQYLQRRRGGG